MRVINKKVSNAPKKTECFNCCAELEYLPEDVHEGLWGMECVTCPECGEEVFVSDERVIKPTWNKTFDHVDSKKAVHLEDNEVQEAIDRCYNYLISDKAKAGDCYSWGCGDVLVFGTKSEEEINVYVTRDWYNDTTCFLSKEF